MYIDLSAMPMDAQVYSYMSNRALSEAEQTHLKAKVSAFLSAWTSHQVPLYAALWVDKIGVFVFVDTRRTTPSGCAKDALQRLMKTEGQSLEVNFFDPYCIVRPTPNGPVWLSAQQLAQQIAHNAYDDTIQIYNARLASKHAFLNARILPLAQSWIAPYIAKIKPQYLAKS